MHRLSKVRRDLLDALYEVAPEGLSGVDLVARTGRSTGAVYSSLYAMESWRWLSSSLEEGEPRLLGRPLKRLYRLEPTGFALVRECQREGWSPAVWRLYLPGNV